MEIGKIDSENLGGERDREREREVESAGGG